MTTFAAVLALGSVMVSVSKANATKQKKRSLMRTRR